MGERRQHGAVIEWRRWHKRLRVGAGGMLELGVASDSESLTGGLMPELSLVLSAFTVHHEPAVRGAAALLAEHLHRAVELFCATCAPVGPAGSAPRTRGEEDSLRQELEVVERSRAEDAEELQREPREARALREDPIGRRRAPIALEDDAELDAIDAAFVAHLRRKDGPRTRPAAFTDADRTPVTSPQPLAPSPDGGPRT